MKWLLLLLCASAQAYEVRILPVGDSITQGNPAHREEYTYRLPLQRSMQSMGIEFDFVGTRTRGLDDGEWPRPFDPDHEGYYGEKTADIVSKVIGRLPSIRAPDIVLVHLGSNDLGWDAESDVAAPISHLIDDIRLRNPHALFLVYDTSPHGPRGWVRWVSLRSLAMRKNSTLSRVRIISPPSDWNSDDTYDGAHPTPQGAAKMARVFLDAMMGN